MSSTTFVLSDYIAQRTRQLESYLGSIMDSVPAPVRLKEAMAYSLLAGGKRLRPLLCLSCATACLDQTTDTERSKLEQAVMPFAAALEMIHTYSLIHDDLPAMDDDDLRRGRPTNHKAFDEATAILAGDGLLTDAFGLMSSVPLPPERVLTAIALTATAAGSSGMVGGQVLDLAGEGQNLEVEALTELTARKTAALLQASCECGAVLAGASNVQRQALRYYGQELGMAFQITDDILDVVGDPALMGKTAGSDAEQHKATWTSCLGLAAARQRAATHCSSARNALQTIPFNFIDIQYLDSIAGALVERSS